MTRLLVATKQLIETLTAWSRRQASETDVSDVYVRLGNEFNIARTCFERANIEMTYPPFPRQTPVFFFFLIFIYLLRFLPITLRLLRLTR